MRVCEFDMDIYDGLSVAILTLILSSCDGKKCPMLHLTGAVYNPATNGYYERTDHQCLDRDIYKQQTNNNSTQPFYMYYGIPSGMNYGWNVGLDPCGDGSIVYNWNNHKRPDYTLRYWVEREESVDNIWYYSFDLRVRCTEGLTFGELIGVIIACIVAVPIIAVIVVVIVKKVKRKHKPRRQTACSSNGPSNALQMATVDTGSNMAAANYGFHNNEDIVTFGMMQFPMSPPAYDEITEGNTSSNHALNVNNNDTSPPTYEQSLAEFGRDPYSEESHSNGDNNQTVDDSVPRAATKNVHDRPTSEEEE